MRERERRVHECARACAGLSVCRCVGILTCLRAYVHVHVSRCIFPTFRPKKAQLKSKEHK